MISKGSGLPEYRRISDDTGSLFRVSHKADCNGNVRWMRPLGSSS
jgi:hypothetical protein